MYGYFEITSSLVLKTLPALPAPGFGTITVSIFSIIWATISFAASLLSSQIYSCIDFKSFNDEAENLTLYATIQCPNLF